MRADTTGSVTAKVGLKRWINVCQEEKGDGQRKWSVDRYQGGVSRSVCCLYSKTYKEGELTSGQAWVGILEKLTVSVVEGHVERSPGQWPLLGIAVVPTRSVVSVVPASTMLGSVRTHVCQSHLLFQGLVPPAESKFTAQPHRAKAQ